MKLPSLLTVLAVFIVLNSVYANDTTGNKLPTIIPIKEAIGKGLVNIRINGAYTSYFIYEILDRGEGMHYGKCMAINLGSKLDSMVLLELESGTLLIPKDDSVQKMLVTHKVLLPLYPHKQYWTTFYAMCTQIYYHPPLGSKEFNIGGMADTNLVKLSKYLELSYNQNMIGQHAVWAYTDKVGFDTLRRYGADTNSIKRTIEILDAVNIVTPLNSEFPKPDIKQSPVPTMTLNSYVVYGGIGLIGVLSLATVVLLMRKNKSKKIVS